MRYSFLLLFFICLLANAYAQNSGKISGVLADSSDSSALQYATVSIYKGADSVLSAYTLTNTKGEFSFARLNLDQKYRLVFNAWQYQMRSIGLTLKTGQPLIRLDTLFFEKALNQLDEVQIVGERPPVIVRKDTIEFNAEAFKTLPTAVVADLLKKLPGVSMGEGGQFLVNGRAVSKILVDGRDFFGGDQQIATRNLPANIIDKVQVTADREALRRDPELTEANVPQVINLKLKKAIKKGVFGKLYAGGGLNDRYETGGILNIFRDTTQISVLGYGNNLNKAGFSMGEIQRIGGFSRSGSSSMMINSNGGFALNGISFGGTGSGIQQSGGAGANFNTIVGKGLTLNAQYFFGQINSDLQELQNNYQTLGEDALTSNSSLQELKTDFSHRLAGKLEWKMDSLTKFTFTPSVALSSMESDWSQMKVNSFGSGSMSSSSYNKQDVDGEGLKYDFRLALDKDFRKKGRSMDLSLTLTKGQDLEQNFNMATNPLSSAITPALVDQFRDMRTENLRSNLYASFSEPLSGKLTVMTSLYSTFLDHENGLLTFFREQADQNYDIAVPGFSETVHQRGWKNNVDLTVHWKPLKDLRITPGIVYNQITLDNSFVNLADFKQSFDFLAPALSLAYKKLRISYYPSFREPDIKVLQPIANNTDPLFIQKGNTALLPARAHSMNLNASNYDVKRGMNYSLYLGGSIQDNAVVNSRTVDQTGVQTSMPVNADGIWSFYSSGNIRKELKSAKRQISLSAGYNVDYDRDVLIVNARQSQSDVLSLRPYGSISFNFSDKIELSQRYAPTYYKSAYEDPFFRDLKVFSHDTETELILRYPKKVVWETSLAVVADTKDIPGYSSTVSLWNAGVTYLFMKNDRAQVRLFVNDILKSKVNRYRYIQQNYIIDRQSNTLGRYALLSLTYNIQNFGGKVGGKERFFGF